MVGEFFVGLDLGQSRDYTAIVVVERVNFVPPPAPPRPRRARGPSAENYAPPAKPATHYHVRLSERPRLGTTYPDVVRRVRTILDAIGAPLDLVVDATGVGRPVIDLIEAARIYPLAVTITGGDSVAHDGRSYRVPKRDLVSTVEILLQERRLKIARDMDHSAALVDELLSFRASISAAGHDTYAAGGSAHDDLVIALALACWRARETERETSGAPIAGVSEAWEHRDDPDALWLGDPANRYLLGYRGGGTRFVPGAGGVTPPRSGSPYRSPFGRR